MFPIPTPPPTNPVIKYIMKKKQFSNEINSLHIWSDISHAFIYLFYMYYVWLLDIDTSECKLLTGKI